MKRLFVVLYIIGGVLLYLHLYFGISVFATTVYTYSLLFVIVYTLLRFLKVRQASLVVVLAVLSSFFIAEVMLRFVTLSHLSYSEQSDMGYIIPYRHQWQNNFRIKYMEGREDLYSIEYKSGEERNYSSRDFQYPNEVCNAHGLRGALPDSSKQIVAVLGDSFVQGLGAPGDSTLPALLRMYLMEKHSDLDVLNGGVAGGDIFFSWKLAQKLQPNYHFKTLVFLLNTTDINEVASRGGNERFRSDGTLEFRPGVCWEPIYAVSFVFRLIVHQLTPLDYNLQSPKQVAERENAALVSIQELICEEILPWCTQYRIEPIFVLHPVEYELNSSELYQKLLLSLQKATGNKALDCRPTVKREASSSTLYWPHDRHFTPEGYNIIANLVIDSCFR